MKRIQKKEMYQTPQTEVIGDDFSAVLCDSSMNSDLEDYDYTEKDLW